jgi:hypothetical protein
MHTSDSIFSVRLVKNVSHQSHLLGLWQHLLNQSGGLANPLKKSRFSRCVNLTAARGERSDCSAAHLRAGAIRVRGTIDILSSLREPLTPTLSP